jgi:hypothetical protein
MVPLLLLAMALCLCVQFGGAFMTVGKLNVVFAIFRLVTFHINAPFVFFLAGRAAIAVNNTVFTFRWRAANFTAINFLAVFAIVAVVTACAFLAFAILVQGIRNARVDFFFERTHVTNAARFFVRAFHYKNLRGLGTLSNARL